MSAPAPPPDSATAGLRRRLLGNVSAQAATFAVSAVLGTTTTVVLARWLGPEGFGGFKFLFAFIYFFQTINDLGINTTLVRDLARTPERTDELVRHTLGLKLVLAIPSVFTAWAAAAWWPGLTPEVRWSVALFALILPIQAMTLPVVTLQARVLIARASFIEIVNRLIGFAGMMLAVVLGYRLLAVTGALVAGELAGLAAVLVLTRRFVVPAPGFGVTTWKEVVRASLPLGMTGLLVSLVNRVDFLLLQLLLGARGLEAVGYYGTAYQVTGVLERLPLFVMATLYPVMSRLSVEDPVALSALYRRSLRNFALLAVPMVAGVMWLAPLAVNLLGGASYAPAVQPLRILVWSTGFLYPAIVAGNLLIALGRTTQSLRAWIIATPSNLVLNILLIPRYGVAGAALATAVSFLIVLIASVIMADRALREAVASLKHPLTPTLSPVPGEREL